MAELEFTGERVVPGRVDVDLWNEHRARYLFASRLARGKRVLDVGSGDGYGAAEIATRATRVVAIDSAPETIGYAAAKYIRPNLTFLAATAQGLPFRDASFDLIVALEIIEHLKDHRLLLQEARRVLSASGQFVVSTPNREYYAESRRISGPNPFHTHEFDIVEFTSELGDFFPHISVFAQNHTDALVFAPLRATDPVQADVSMEPCNPQVESSHFFVAVCALTPQTGAPTFVHLPRAANVLQEREHHIAKLEQELDQKNEWLNEARTAHAELVELHAAQTSQLEASNRWATQVDRELDAATSRIRELDDQVVADRAQFAETTAVYEAKISDLERENIEKTHWAQDTERRLTAELEERTAHLLRCQELLTEAESTLEQRTRWALDLEEANQHANARLRTIAASRWVRLGRVFGVGPEIREQ